MAERRTIEVGALARVEGEGALHVTVEDGAVAELRLDIYEPPRRAAHACRTVAKEELRLQVGNFRQDLNTLAASKGTKAERKAGLAKAKELIVACEDLDYAMTKKDLGKAQALYGNVKSKLSDFQSYALA